MKRIVITKYDSKFNPVTGVNGFLVQIYSGRKVHRTELLEGSKNDASDFRTNMSDQQVASVKPRGVLHGKRLGVCDASKGTGNMIIGPGRDIALRRNWFSRFGAKS